MCYLQSVLFFLTIGKSPYLALSVCWHTENTLLVVSNCTQVLLRFPLLASFPRLSLSVDQQMHTHTHTRFHIHSHACTRGKTDRGVLKVNRCELLTCVKTMHTYWAFCFLHIAFYVVVLSAFSLSFFYFLSAHNCCVCMASSFCSPGKRESLRLLLGCASLSLLATGDFSPRGCC